MSATNSGGARKGDFKSREQRRLAELVGQGDHARRGHVLPAERAIENLYPACRGEALQYFATHRIKWWLSRNEAEERRVAGVSGLPTGNLGSSQVACVNHLEPARTDYDLALAIARAVDPSVAAICPIPAEGGYVAFEWISESDLLGERGSRQRGANVTSLDALMLARRPDLSVVAIVIEWKYLEGYDPKSHAISSKGTNRVETYRPLLEDRDSPLRQGELERLFFQPYVQLMRQTLLAWQMTRQRMRGWPAIDDWKHAHVIPEGNVRLRRHIPPHAAYAELRLLSEAWKSFLKVPDRYEVLTPTELLPPAGEIDPELADWRGWLSTRYLT